jgi:hypothetical protein
MNERIRKLAEQADKLADNQIQMPGEFHPDWSDIRDQKFAELIVRQTMDYASRNWEHGHLLAEDLKVYFGVE